MTSSLSDLVIRSLTPCITIFSRPFLRYTGVPVGARSTAIRLNEGDNKDMVWVLASSECDNETIDEINKLGQVKYLIAPDTAHFLYLKQFIEAFPKAKVVGVDGVQHKTDIKFDYIFGQEPSDKPVGYEPEIQTIWFDKYINKDLAFYHPSSKTLIQADLLMNLPAREQYSKSDLSCDSWLPFASTIRPGTLTHRIAALAMSKNANEVRRVYNEWDFDRIIPSHGDVIESNGKKAWYEVFSRYL